MEAQLQSIHQRLRVIEEERQGELTFYVIRLGKMNSV